jgi:acyl-coenzyme A thioesterase PaaI-like protein
VQPGCLRPSGELAGRGRAGSRESLKTWFRRLRFNLFPAFRGTGAKVVYIAENKRAIRIKLPLNWRTRNIYGTLFGGAMYAATDPLYALLIKVGLGPGYIVWDKAGSIRYRKPGRTTLYAQCSVTDAELQTLRTRLELEPSVDLEYEIRLTDAEGQEYATIIRTIYVAKTESYQRKLEQDSNRGAASAT